MATINNETVQPINGVIEGTELDDTIIADAVDTGTVLEIRGLGDDDTIATSGDNMTLDGGAGLDSLQSSGKNNTLLGGPGDDFLLSLFGADNTTMDGGPGDDFLAGGSGTNTASYASAPAGVVVDLSTFSANDGSGGTDTLLGIQNVTGSAFADSLTGDEFANVLDGGAGDDTLVGGPGADVFKYSFTLTEGKGTTSTFTDFLSKKFGKDFGDELPDYAPTHHHHHHHHDKHGDDDGRHDHRHHKHGDDDGHHSKHGDHDHHHKHGGDDGHHAHDGGLSEKFFENNYKEWLKEVVVTDLLAQGFELDANGNGKIKININEDSPDGTPRIEGLTQQQLAEIFGDRDSVILNDGGETEKAFYSNSFTSGKGKDTVTSDDGFDTIVDFKFGEDKLDFSGITKGQFLASFVVDDNQNVDGAGGADTVITIAENADWSLTLLEVSGPSLQDFAADSIFS